MKPTVVDIHDAENHFRDYTPLLDKGISLLIYRDNKPFAEVHPVNPSTTPAARKFGRFKGQISVPEDFNVPDLEVESMFNDSEIFPAPKGNQED